MAVKRRPLFHEKTDELEALVQRAIAKGDLRTLKSVRRELRFCSTKRARTLAEKVQTVIGKCEDAVRQVGTEIFPPNRKAKPKQQVLFPFVFDEELYAKAKPYFVRLWNVAGQAGLSLREFIALLLERYEKAKIQPYIVRFLQDVQDDNIETRP